MTTAHYVNQVAPNYVHAGAPQMRGPSSSAAAAPGSSSSDDSFTFTVGKLDAGMAILIGERASLIEFPSLLLPHGVSSGSVVNIRVLRNQHEEARQKNEFDQLQDDILSTFGTEAPKAPALRLRNVTQTSVTLEWDRLSLATASLLSLDIYRNGQRLAPIPNPLHNTSTKLSGLDLDAEYTFHLVLKTSAGTFSSPVIRTRTHTITETSGISVCFGHVSDPDVLAASKEALGKMRAKWSDRIQIDTTHFVCTDPHNPGDTNAAPGAAANGQGNGYAKAMQLSIPVVKPHWIFACLDQKKMVGIAPFYLDQDPPNATTLRESINKMRGGVQPASQQQQQQRDGGERTTTTKTTDSAATTAAAATAAATAAAEAMDTAVPPTPLPKSPASGPGAEIAPEGGDGTAALEHDHDDETTTTAAAAGEHTEDEDAAYDLPPIPLSMMQPAAGSEDAPAPASAAAAAAAEVEQTATTTAPHEGIDTETASSAVRGEEGGKSNELGLQLSPPDEVEDLGTEHHRVPSPLGSPNPSIEVTGPDEESSTPIGFDDDDDDHDGIHHFQTQGDLEEGHDDHEDGESLTRRLEMQAQAQDANFSAPSQSESQSHEEVKQVDEEEEEEGEGEMDDVSLGGGPY